MLAHTLPSLRHLRGTTTSTAPQRSVRGAASFAKAVRLLRALSLLVAATGCREKSPPEAEVSVQGPIPAVTRLPTEYSQQVLAKVGERRITLADYALVLDRMDRIERMRYQTPERRRALLDEIINSELLAQEAERRGLDKDPATLAYIDQLFRDEIRRRLRAEVPTAEELPTAEVQAYYAAHRDEFRSPELRRIAAIAMSTEAAATALLVELTTSPTAEKWNDAAVRHSVAARHSELPVEIVGDMGLAPAPTRPLEQSTNSVPAASNDSDTSRIPLPVRAAAFSLSTPGQVFATPVKADGKVYLVRLVAINAARTLSLEEAEDQIRARLVNQKLDATYAALHERLAAEASVSGANAGAPHERK